MFSVNLMMLEVVLKLVVENGANCEQLVGNYQPLQVRLRSIYDRIITFNENEIEFNSLQ